MRINQFCYVFLLIPITLFYTSFSYAVEKVRWSVSPLLGIYQPVLSGLNGAEFMANIPGQGDIIIDEESSVSFDFELRNPLSDIRFGTEAGLELELAINEKDSILIGLSSWEGLTTSAVRTEMPFQGILNQVAFERSANISFTQYFLGWKHIFLSKPKNYNVYSRITMHELFDIDLKEDLVFSFDGGPGDSFKRVVVTESQATGILMLQYGLGIEYFVLDWFSFGFDAGFSFSLKKFRLGNARLKSDFQGGDNVNLSLPTILDNDQQLLYWSNESESYKKLLLSFDGWRALMRATFYF